MKNLFVGLSVYGWCALVAALHADIANLNYARSSPWPEGNDWYVIHCGENVGFLIADLGGMAGAW